jgi:hypothetical protein
MAGVPPELAQAVNMVTTLGRRPTTAARPVRLPRQSRSQPGTAAQPSPGRPSAQQGRVQVSTSRPGVYVQPPPRTPRIKLRCFKKNKTGSKAEYDRQLADQERGLNDMSVKDYLEGRARYREMGRKGTGAAQEAARAEYARELTEKFENDLLKQGIVGSQAQQRAAAMAAERMKTLAALHSPDLIAGGKDVVSSLGDRGVNSSIGAQWKPRVQVLDAAAMKVPETERAGTKMNAELVRCP